MQYISSSKSTAEKKSASSNSSFFVPVQPKLTINQPNDVYEQEADAVADRVMRMTDNQSATPSFFQPAAIPIQRKCAHCEEEEKKVQRKEQSNTDVSAPGEVTQYVAGLNNTGATLPAQTHQFFASRMGYDFSNVKVHTDSVAAKSAQSINALAYTSGNNIVFNQNQYQPETDTGKKLLAHELTHVVQQQTNLSAKRIQRALGRRTSCTANQHSAPADPIADIRQANDRAVHMSLGSSMLLDSESLFIQSATFGPSDVFNFYKRRFGEPVSNRRGKFPNRFTSGVHDTLLLAQASELQFLSQRIKRISDFLKGNIHFRCTGTSRTTIGECTHRCGTNTVLASCSAGHGSEMAICSEFWNIGGTDFQAIGMIHEVSHMLYHYGDRDTAPYADTHAQRRREPECYASLVADIYGVTPFDPSCPIIP